MCPSSHWLLRTQPQSQHPSFDTLLLSGDQPNLFHCFRFALKTHVAYVHPDITLHGPRKPLFDDIMNRIMLRYRPIAPKPVVDGSACGSKPENDKTEVVSKRRRKRKYVRVKKNTKCNDHSTVEEERKDRCLKIGGDDDGSVVTLQLLPESVSSNSSSEKSPPGNRSFQKELSFSMLDQPLWMNYQKYDNIGIFAISSPQQLDLKVATEAPRMVESLVMVDGTTKTFLDGEALGSTDMEKMRNMEMDTCPGLISDGLDRVKWVNPAYRRMVYTLEDGGPPVNADMVVRLVVKEKISEKLPAFACTVRVVYTWRNSKHSRTMPCDVWKMDFGGFAWRLDSKAALSLGR